MKKLSFVQRSNGSNWIGDGFPVRSIFSYNDIAPEVSPFILLDYAAPAHFTPTRSRRGVGEHPHRGFETVTIVYSGEVEHRDSSGGGGIIGPGDVQWMTAGAGVVHEEFHGPNFAKKGGVLEMIQLWVNLPSKDKMTGPAYQSITDTRIPRIELPHGGQMRVIAGQYKNTVGPAHTFTPMNVWDMSIQGGKRMSFEVPESYTASLFVLKGRIRTPNGTTIGEAELAVFDRDGSSVEFSVIEDAKILLLAGEPLDEPIAGSGPFVMNTAQEIEQAIADYENGQMGTLPVRSA